MARLFFTFILCVFSVCCFSSEDGKRRDSIQKVTERGFLLYGQERYSEALECYTKALEWASAANDYKSQIVCLGNIGNIFAIYGDYDRSIYYNRLGYNLACEHKDSGMQTRFACMLVEISCCNDDIKSADTYYKLLMGTNGKWSQGDKYHWMICQAKLAKAKKKYSEAVFYYRKALTFATDHGMNSKYVITTLHELGNTYLSLHQTEKALAEYGKALQLAKKIKSGEMISETYQLYSTAYRLSGDAGLAEKYKAWAVQISDSLFNKKRFNYAKNKLFEYEEKVKNDQILVLSERVSAQTAVIAFISVIAVMLVVFAAVIFRKNKRLHEAHNLLLDKMSDLEHQEKRNKELRKDIIDTRARIATGTPGNRTPEEGAKPEKRADVGIGEEQEAKLLDSIMAIMEDVETISKPDFSLNTLVNMLHSNTSYVSWCINDSLGKNFKTLLNEYRIKEACRRLSDTATYKRLTVQAVYEDLGYKSASNFIKAFKNVIGMTPSQYQRIIKERKETATTTEI